MDKTSKLEYQKKLEKYLESKNVYNIFEGLLQSLIISKPANPFDFLIEKLSQHQTKKIFFVGPAGSNVRELALVIADDLKYTCVNVGDLLAKEISKKTAFGQEIEYSLAKYAYVKDDIVIQIVKKEIDQLEKEQKDFILEGFPKTRPQGLALQRAGIIPNTFIILNLEDKKILDGCLNKIKNSMYCNNVSDNEKLNLAENHVKEYNLNIKELKEIYNNFYFQVELNNYKGEDITDDIARLLKYRIKTSAPKTIAKIIVTGPPGAGRTTLAKSLSLKYGLIYISTSELIKEIIRKKNQISPKLFELFTKGELIPDEIMIPILNSRIQKTDCQLQGYVLDGFPKSLSQFKCLEDLKLTPSLVVALDNTQDITLDRLSYRKIDPLTGIHYDISDIHNLSQEISNRLQQNPVENIEVLQKRFMRWKEILKYLETNFSDVLFKTSSNLDPNNILEKVSSYLESS